MHVGQTDLYTVCVRHHLSDSDTLQITNDLNNAVQFQLLSMTDAVRRMAFITAFSLAAEEQLVGLARKRYGVTCRLFT